MLRRTPAATSLARIRAAADSSAGEASLVVALLGSISLLLSRGLETPTTADEGVYLASLEALRRGEELGTEVFASQPPGFYLLLRAVAFVFGDSVQGMRAGMLLVAVLGCAAAYVVGRTLGGRIGGLSAAALLTVAAPFSLDAVHVSADIPGLALAMVAVALAAVAWHRTPPGGSGALLLGGLAGATFAAAVSVKLLALTAALALATLAVSLRPTSRSLGSCLLGAAAVSGALVGAYSGELDALWHDAVRYHTDARAAADGLALLHLASADPAANLRTLLRALDPWAPFAWIALAIALASVTRRSSRSALRLSFPEPAALWLWTAATAALLAWHKPLFAQHAVYLAGPVALAAGSALGLLIRRHGLPRAALTLISAALLAAAVQAGVRLERYATGDPPELMQAAALLAASTPPNGPVAADVPIVAVYADRPIPGRLVDPSYVRFAARSLSTRSVLVAIDRDRVGAVVAGRAFLRQPGLMEALGVRFRVRRQVGGLTIFLRAPPRSRPWPAAGAFARLSRAVSASMWG